MEFTIKSGSPEKQRSACVVVGVFDNRKLSLSAAILGRRNRNAAPPMEAKTAASGSSLRNERRVDSTVMFVHLHAFDGTAFEFLPENLSHELTRKTRI